MQGRDEEPAAEERARLLNQSEDMLRCAPRCCFTGSCGAGLLEPAWLWGCGLNDR